MDYQEKYDFALKVLEKYHNYIEIADFRKFLLLLLNLESGGPEAMLQRLGMAPKDKTTLPYDPEKEVYFTKIMSGFSLKNQLIIYNRSPKLSENFVNTAESDLVTKNLTEYERKNLLPKDYVIISPEVVDNSAKKRQKSDKSCEIGIESIYTNLAELITTQNLKFFFLLEGDIADLVFTINMSMENPQESEKSTHFFDVYVDEDKKLRDYTFIRMKKESIRKGNLDMEYLDEIKELNHSARIDSKFTIIIPVKSLEEI